MTNIQSKMLTLILALLGFTFSSCMHAVMMSGHDGHEGMESIIVTKEVSSGDYTLAVTVPPMETNKELTISITLKSKSGDSDNATVHYMIMNSVMDSASTGHEHSTKGDSEEFKPIHQSVSLINGTASFVYKPTIAGQFTLTAETKVDSITLSADVNFMVHEKKGHGMMGMGADWDYPIIGVLAMSAMMITMWAARSGF